MSRTYTISLLLIGGFLLVLGPYLPWGDFTNPPQPPEPPVPPGERLVVAVSQSESRTVTEATVLNELAEHLRSKNQEFRWMDPDQAKDSTWLNPVLQEIQSRQVPLPVLTVLVRPTNTSQDGDFAYLVVDPLPGGAREAIALVDEALALE